MNDTTTRMQSDWNAVGPDLLAAMQHIGTWLAAPDLTPDTLQEMRDTACRVLAKAERSATPGGLRDFLRSRFGANWVLARRTASLVSRYGADVRCLTQREYRQAEIDYLNGVAP